MKVAAAEQPRDQETDIDQIDRNHIWRICRSWYDSDSTQYKEYESNDQNESKYAAADVHVDLQVVRLSGHWNIKRTKQSGRYRT